jgi:hypothetical protein
MGRRQEPIVILTDRHLELKLQPTEPTRCTLYKPKLSVGPWSLTTAKQARQRKHLDSLPLITEPIISGMLGGLSVSALGDKGATANFISADHVQRQCAEIDKDACTVFTKPNGTLVETLGVAKLLFRFDGESDAHLLTFHVLKNCLYDVILGNPFLQATATFTRYFHRIAHVLRAGRSRHVCLAGNPQQRLEGFLNGQYTRAVDDSGSNVNLESPEFAERSGHKVDTSPQHRIELEFVDGTIGHASGVVKRARWTSDKDRAELHTTDIYVLPGLAVDLLLGYPFLRRIKAYSRYAGSLLGMKDSEHEMDGSYLWSIITTGETILDLCKRKLLGRQKECKS